MITKTKKTPKSSGWLAKVSRVLIFAMLFGSLWYSPKIAEADVVELQPWSNVYHGTATTQQTVAYPVPAGTNTNRLLVVAIASSQSTVAARTVAISYGAQNLTSVIGDMATTTTRQHTQLYYLNEAGLDAASNTNLVFTVSGGTTRITDVFVAVYDLVNQGTPITNSRSYNSVATAVSTAAFATALTVNALDQAVEIVSCLRAASTTPRTITYATNWTMQLEQTWTTTDGVRNGTAIRSIPATNTTDASSTTFSGTCLASMSGMSLQAAPPNLTVGNGTNPANADAPRTAPTALDAFTLSASLPGGSVNTLTLTGSANFTTANISGVKIYADNGTVGTFDAADVLVPSSYSAITTNATTITFTTPETVGTSAKEYLVVVDVAAAATLAQTFTGRITAATGYIGTPTYSDTNSATLTIVAAPTLTVGNGTNPANANAPRTAIAALDAFTLVTANAGAATVNTLTVTGSANFTTANIAGVNIYADNGTIGTLDAADVLVPSSYSAITANVTTVTFNAPLSVTTAPTNCLITVNIAAAATLAQTFTGRITAATGSGLGTPTYSDTNSATLTITAAPTLTVGNGTNPANANAKQYSPTNALDGFTMATVNPGAASVNTLTVTGSANFTASNVYAVNIYADNGTIGTLDAADVLLSSGHTHAGSIATVTLTSPEPVTTTAKNYLVVVGIGAGTLSQTFTGTVTGASGSGLGTPTYSDTNSATLTIVTGAKAINISCSDCHGYPVTDGTRSGATGAVVGAHQSHTSVCSTCHTAPASQSSADYAHRNGNIDLQPGATAIDGGYYDKNSDTTYNAGSDNVFAQNNIPTTATCRTVACHGGVTTPQWGVGTLTCLDCHTNPMNGRRAVVGEFGLTWSHKRAAGGVVNAVDCGVCHMEGATTFVTNHYEPTGKTDPAFHGNGTIELRDPDTNNTIEDVSFSGTGAGSYAPIPGQARSFTDFSRNLGVTLESDPSFSTIAAIQVNHCLKCHDTNGSSQVWVSGGTALKPFGTTVASTTTYYLNNIAAGNASGSVMDVYSSFNPANASYHPVRGKQNNSYAAGTTNMVAPWTAAKTAGNNTQYGPLMSCWDCHAATGASGTLTSTVTAHGSASILRAPLPNAATTTGHLCYLCHATKYGTTTDNHGTGTSFSTGGSDGDYGNKGDCAKCHGSSIDTRPWRGVDWHGFNQWAELRTDTITPANSAKSGPAVATGHRPYNFIRTANLAHVNPNTVPAADGTWTPSGNRPGCVRSSTYGTGYSCGNSHATFGPGGVY